jgi:hypothetical protein
MTTRIEEARGRAATAKRVLAILSAAGFLAALGLARASHPGHSATSSVTFTPTTVSAPQSGGFDVQTHAS